MVDKIIVVDAFSEDKTVEICQKVGAKVVQKKWEVVFSPSETSSNFESVPLMVKYFSQNITPVV